ncbi:Mitochondrial zinc maintenance protein 1, mitochondrial [Neolecta irregularis DAH-3]|uniref:Mitochondrial zinc maintenance protein 1, mitochondrial n=1 Tax=Neolecta irregularis (strain DAH-3) TaxID=1198029 RepID=A0A1U7LP30_NEOID|nr:Mitochondrial zinc maintenance protein 1, mitochondrial [Neolecta irregularis DAH-3]|eukprot:OLL24302.1 Mitochondrial zinc maintenance protein 1, mitochondrial [Neolecta irregularis DAH-3]
MSQSQLLRAYRSLWRTILGKFRDDPIALVAAHQRLRSEFATFRKSSEEGLALAKDVEQILRKNVVRATKEGNLMRMELSEEAEMGDNTKEYAGKKRWD